jgi:hypothetical protein
LGLTRDLGTHQALSKSHGALANIFQSTSERSNHLSSSKWFKYGDTCSKTFFDFHRIGKKKTLLKELEAKGGTVSGQAILSQFITGFYANLYASKAHALSIQEVQNMCWDIIPARVTEAMNASMTKELDLKEVIGAISSLPKGKGLGHDGILTEFFQDFVEEVAPTLLATFRAMLKQGKTFAHINRGMITLTPKSRDHYRLGNWRPITLLGSIYKILAKTLAGRLQAILPLIIRPNQTGFVEGRSILDNTFLARKALD